MRRYRCEPPRASIVHCEVQHYDYYLTLEFGRIRNADEDDVDQPRDSHKLHSAGVAQIIHIRIFYVTSYPATRKGKHLQKKKIKMIKKKSKTKQNITSPH